MRSKARQILSSVRQQLLFACICIFGSIFVSANGQQIDAQIADGPVNQRIYYVTMPINRSVGPYLRQLKILIPNVPAPYNDTKLYDGDTWDQLVDKLLIKRDSVVQDRRAVTQVVVPLPAACFDSSLSNERRQKCLQDPAGFAKGYITMRLYDVKDGDTLPDVLSRHGVYPTRDGSTYYNQQRWMDVVRNFNPRINQWNRLVSGSVFILPLLNESDFKSGDVPSIVEATGANGEISLASDQTTPGSTTDAPTEIPTEVLGNGTNRLGLPPVSVPAPTVTTPLPVATPAAPAATPPATVESAAKPAPVILPEAKFDQATNTDQKVETKPDQEQQPTKVTGTSASKAAGSQNTKRKIRSDLSLIYARNVLSSVKIPMLVKQNHFSLGFTRSDPDASDWWIKVDHAPAISGRSDSPYLIETDDPQERYKFTNLEFGTKFYLTGMIPSWAIHAGLYARWISMDLRYWISNQSDETAYLVNRNASRNVGAGVTAGVDHTRGRTVYRFNVVKDLYEFVDQAVQIDRTSGRLSATSYFPDLREEAGVKRHLGLFVESETLNVNLVSDSALLQVTMKRMSVGVGAGLVW
jgi:hypothetical protein